MASLHYDEYFDSQEAFSSSPFPSSPEQVAIFSPYLLSDEESSYNPGHFGVYDQQMEAPRKITQSAVNREKRRAALSGVPQRVASHSHRKEVGHYEVNLPAPSSSSDHLVSALPSETYLTESPMGTGLCSLEGYSLDGSPVPQQATGYSSGSSSPSWKSPSSSPAVPAFPVQEQMPMSRQFPFSGRIKSTTPDLELLFSLFDVLEPSSPFPPSKCAAAACFQRQSMGSFPGKLRNCPPASSAPRWSSEMLEPLPGMAAAEYPLEQALPYF